MLEERKKVSYDGLATVCPPRYGFEVHCRSAATIDLGPAISRKLEGKREAVHEHPVQIAHHSKMCIGFLCNCYWD